ncbi:hypothetical protein [Alcaligenes phenolicus]|nr:hypothetical protein [Alcaligenes phenolicus]
MQQTRRTKLHHNANQAILVLECPWILDEQDSNRSSVLPFVEGIAKMAGGTDVFHANFYDKNSFIKALSILCSVRFENAIIYIAAHGNEKHIGNVKLNDIFSKIGEYSKKSNITGLMLGSCFTGANMASPQSTLQGTNLYWCCGYSSSSEWLSGVMIDCSIISEMINTENISKNNQNDFIELFSKALAPFSPKYIIGEDSKKNPVTLDESIRVVTQPSGQGLRAKEITKNIFKKN